MPEDHANTRTSVTGLLARVSLFFSTYGSSHEGIQQLKTNESTGKSFLDRYNDTVTADPKKERYKNHRQFEQFMVVEADQVGTTLQCPAPFNHSKQTNARLGFMHDASTGLLFDKIGEQDFVSILRDVQPVLLEIVSTCMAHACTVHSTISMYLLFCTMHCVPFH